MKNLFIVLILLFNCYLISAQEANQSDSVAIKQAANDYIDGILSCNPEKVQKALNVDFLKGTTVRIKNSTVLDFQSYSIIIERINGKLGFTEESKRNIDVRIINIDEDVANVKVTSSVSADYIQLLKFNNEWKIFNILSSKINSDDIIKQNSLSDEDKSLINNTVDYYIEGINYGDSKRMEISICSEYSKLTFNKLKNTGKSFTKRQKAESIKQSCFAGIRKMDETKCSYNVKILDAINGIAIAEIKSLYYIEFVQLYKNNNEWLIFNSIEKVRNDLTFDDQFPVSVDEQFPDFTLPVYNGGDFTLSKYKGKNVMLIAPRGWIGGIWCPLCHYQYLELAELEKLQKIKKKYNMEIVFLLPYDKEKIKNWFEGFPQSLETIETWKTIDLANAPAYQKDFVNYVKKNYPQKFEIKKDEITTYFPILIDSEQKLSKRLMIFTKYWDEVSSEQNIPAIFIIDKTGKVQFKYLSQITFDRPSYNYIFRFIEKMGLNK